MKKINRPAVFTALFVIAATMLIAIIIALVIGYHQDLANTKQQLISPSIYSSDAEIWRKNSSYYVLVDGKTYYITEESAQNQIDNLINRLELRFHFGILCLTMLALTFALYRYYYGTILEIQEIADTNQAKLEKMLQNRIDQEHEELAKAEFRKNAELYDWASEEPTEVLTAE